MEQNNGQQQARRFVRVLQRLLKKAKTLEPLKLATASQLAETPLILILRTAISLPPLLLHTLQKQKTNLSKQLNKHLSAMLELMSLSKKFKRVMPLP